MAGPFALGGHHSGRNALRLTATRVPARGLVPGVCPCSRVLAMYGLSHLTCAPPASVVIASVAIASVVIASVVIASGPITSA